MITKKEFKKAAELASDIRWYAEAQQEAKDYAKQKGKREFAGLALCDNGGEIDYIFAEEKVEEWMKRNREKIDAFAEWLYEGVVGVFKDAIAANERELATIIKEEQ